MLAGVLPRMYSLSESLFVDDAGGDTGTAGKWNRFGCKIGRMPVPLQFPCLCWTSFTGFWPYSFCCKLRLFSGVARAASAAAAVFILTDYQVTDCFLYFPLAQATSLGIIKSFRQGQSLTLSAQISGAELPISMTTQNIQRCAKQIVLGNGLAKCLRCIFCHTYETKQEIHHEHLLTHKSIYAWLSGCRCCS